MYNSNKIVDKLTYEICLKSEKYFDGKVIRDVFKITGKVICMITINIFLRTVNDRTDPNLKLYKTL